MREVQIELLQLVQLGLEGDVLNFFKIIVISNFSIKKSCVRFCILCSCMSL